MLSNQQWDGIQKFVEFLDEDGTDELARQGRLLKISEELGEVTSAYIGMTGTNKRKGVTHTNEDLCDELADVMIAAAIALATFAEGNPADALNRKLAGVIGRIGQQRQG